MKTIQMTMLVLLFTLVNLPSANAQFFWAGNSSWAGNLFINTNVNTINGGTFAEFDITTSRDVGMQVMVSEYPIDAVWDGQYWRSTIRYQDADGYDVEFNPVNTQSQYTNDWVSNLEVKNLRPDTLYYYVVFPASGNYYHLPKSGSFKTWRRVVTAQMNTLDMIDDGENGDGEFRFKFSMRSADGMDQNLPPSAVEDTIHMYQAMMLTDDEVCLGSGDYLVGFVGEIDNRYMSVDIGDEDEIRVDVSAIENDVPDFLVDRYGTGITPKYFGTYCTWDRDFSSAKEFVYLGHLTDESGGNNSFEREQFSEIVTLHAVPHWNVDIEYKLWIRLYISYHP